MKYMRTRTAGEVLVHLRPTVTISMSIICECHTGRCWTAVEILLKVPLAHEHWTLVCSGKKLCAVNINVNRPGAVHTVR